MRGCSGSTAGSGSASSSATSRSSRSGSSTLPARWAVTSRKRPGSTACAVEHLGAGGGARAEQQRDVDHHVAHDLHAPGDPLGAQVLRRGLRGAQQQRGGVVGQHAVELLGHRAVERAHPRLDVGDRDPGLGGRQRARRASSSCRRRRARGRGARAASSPSSASSMRAVWAVFEPPPEVELVLGAREAELAEEDLRRAPRRSAGPCGRAPPPRSPAAGGTPPPP